MNRFCLCLLLSVSLPIQAQLLPGVKREDWGSYKPLHVYTVGESGCHLLPDGIDSAQNNPEVASVEEATSPDGSSLYEHIVFKNGEVGMFYYFRTGASCESWSAQLTEAKQAEAPYGYPLNDHMKMLEAKYAHRLQFDDQVAKYLVNQFSLDCQSRDRRYLPLRHLLLAKISQMDSPNMWMTIRAESRGDEVRLYDVLHKKGESTVMEIPAILLNRWGELESLNGKMEAIMNSCTGSNGPIWLTMPQQTG